MHAAFTPQNIMVLPAHLHNEVPPPQSTQYSIEDLFRFLQIDLPERVAPSNTIFILTTLKSREKLYRTGSRFKNLYIVLSGLLMTSFLDEDGTERPTSFLTRSDIVGIDGIGSGRYGTDAVALAPSLILILPFKTMIASAEAYPTLLETLKQLISREVVRTRVTAYILRSFRCHASLAHFLLEMAEKLISPGAPLCSFSLPISRREIGNFLGFTYETISRTLTDLHHQGLIKADGNSITVLNHSKLKTLSRTA
jgi:CRP/FNR family transcriptional regulator